MESQRTLVVIGLLMVSFLLWQQWQLDYGPKPVAPVTTAPNSQNLSVEGSDSADIPATTDLGSHDLPSTAVANSSRVVTVKTDTLDVSIDTRGGDVIAANLVDFPVTQGADDAYSLLRPDNATLYVAQSGLIGPDGIDTASGRANYQAAQDSYSMQGDTLRVPLTWQSQDMTVQKVFTFYRGEHYVDVTYEITNTSDSNKQVQQFAQLKQTINLPEGSMFMPTYRGAAYSTADERYEKYSFDDIEDERLNKSTVGGWVGMLEHYFVSAWIPPQEETNKLNSRILSDQFAVIGYTTTSKTIAPGQQGTLKSTLYMGPKDQDKLAQLARGLDLTVDYGFLWFISQPLFKLLQWIHELVNNWGVAIIIITIIVKGAMYPLTKKQYESMAKMRNLAPKMQQLKERYGDDRQKMSQAMMEMYRKEKVNPMGGCFPLLLQMPIFLALYWVLLESVELRHADFALWITDLSVKDPYFVLPILTGVSMWLLQKLQPMTIQDPMQQKIMQWMPVAMSLFFFIFPAGLVLYWLISNVITLVQAKIIYSSMEKRGLKTS
ncbi:membrane protein insertase YidC [Aestuariibacter halophilus]|uniref:Membrane protein insertase YidC n=1 Tax=Fluctibacter halophilus TaxID=226011 RepID=A0ABS8G8R8_9ALTE|nr:membrane protein insertase YidC [Aestuariibacter halophilus]MCC2616928.1 membrane protein insertase YidC [Aestuariibacter halophilus]